MIWDGYYKEEKVINMVLVHWGPYHLWKGSPNLFLNYNKPNKQLSLVLEPLPYKAYFVEWKQLYSFISF